MIHDNSPALGWVRLTDTIITYKNKSYYVPDDSTEKKYVYWEAEHPSLFTFSNTILEETTERFLILINDNGMHTPIKSKYDYFDCNFDMSVRESVNQKLYGLYEKNVKDNKENSVKFSNIVHDIDSITTTVGEFKLDTEKNFTQVRQTAKDIDARVENIDYRLTDNEKAKKFTKAMMELIEYIGNYEMAMQSIMSDNELDASGTGSEREEINARNETLKVKFDKFVAELREMANDKDLQKRDKIKTDNIKDTMIPTCYNLYTDIRDITNKTADKGVYNQTDKQNVYTQFEKAVSILSGYKDSINELLALGYGGNIISTVSNLFLNKNNGGFNFVKRMDNSDTNISMLKIGLDGFRTEVTNNLTNHTSRIVQLEDEITTKVSSRDFNSEIRQLDRQISSKVSTSDFSSLIKQNADSIRISFNSTSTRRDSRGRPLSKYDRDYESGVPDYEITSEGLTVNHGYVATDMLQVPSGHDPVIKLFGGTYRHNMSASPRIDASEEYMQGVGESIRLNWNDGNYIKIYNGGIEFYDGSRDGSPHFRMNRNGLSLIDQVYKGSDGRMHDGEVHYVTEATLNKKINEVIRSSSSSDTKYAYVDKDSNFFVAIPSSQSGYIRIYQNGNVHKAGKTSPTFRIRT